MTLCGNPLSRSLLGVKRTWPVALHMSAFDPSRTFTLSEAAGVLVSPGTTATKRNNAMTSITMGLEKTEQEILAFEVADVALEIASGTAKEKANFTLGACTGLSECPG
jgi:hypothetical protein